jgi:hypothetical protein
MLRKTVLAISFCGVAALVCAASGLWSEWPGGIRPSYDARDDDPGLTAIAAGALPVIDALERYVAGRKAYPAGDDEAGLSALAAELGGSGAMHRSMAGVEFGDGWSYSRGTEVSSYSLSKKLGWDTALEFRRDALGAQWVFVRGDGTDDVAILLHPRPLTASQ